MSNRVDAIIQYSLLKWGRESIGYEIEIAAKKIGVSIDTLKNWENGTTRPTVNQLLKIAEVYKRPFAVFYLPIPPNQMDEPFDTLRDWRKLADSTDHKKSIGLILELREALRRREILLDLAEEMNEEITEFDITYQNNMSSTDLSRLVRNQLNITYMDQVKIKNIPDALKIWRTAVEKLNILVFQTGFFTNYPIRVEEMRGIAIYYDRLPIIVINSKDSHSARIFTLVHELGHLILRLSGISNTYEDNGLNQEEIFCNEFAGELLVPSNHLIEEPEVKSHDSLIWSDEVLDLLSRRYSISKEVILRKLLTLQRTTESHYQEKREQWREEWIAINETRGKQEKSSGGPQYHTKFVRCHGVRFVETAFEAYNRGVIPANQLSEYLGTKMKHIPKILDHLRALS